MCEPSRVNRMRIAQHAHVRRRRRLPKAWAKSEIFEFTWISNGYFCGSLSRSETGRKPTWARYKGSLPAISAIAAVGFDEEEPTNPTTLSFHSFNTPCRALGSEKHVSRTRSSTYQKCMQLHIVHAISFTSIRRPNDNLSHHARKIV